MAIVCVKEEFRDLRQDRHSWMEDPKDRIVFIIIDLTIGDKYITNDGIFIR